MPKKFGPEVDLLVKTLSESGFTDKEIIDGLLTRGITISRRTISNIKNQIGKQRQALAENREIPAIVRAPKVRTKQTIAKIKKMVVKEDPESYRNIQKRYPMSLKTINRVIHEDLNLGKRTKSRVHRLNDKQKKNRKRNSRKLCEDNLSGKKSEFVVSLDEALVYLNNCNGHRRICYVKNGKDIPEDWVYERPESFANGFMIVGAITGRGVLPLIRVPPKAKINADYYIDYVLKPLLEKELPKLYGKDMNKVFLHHDKASSHTAHKTQVYLEELKTRLGINYIKNSDIPVKTPDGSPMDFFGFGYLKQKLFRRRAISLNGLWKACQQEWSQIDQNLVDKVFSSWKKRLRMISKMNGGHIENTKAIHRKSIRL